MEVISAGREQFAFKKKNKSFRFVFQLTHGSLRIRAILLGESWTQTKILRLFAESLL